MQKETGRQLDFVIDGNNQFQTRDPEEGMPPKPNKWPTAEEIRALASSRAEIEESLRRVRGRAPLVNSDTYKLRVR